jgi:Short C-terminal domain
VLMRRRPLLRAAAVGGTAYIAGRHVANRQAAEVQAQDEQNERLDNLEQQPVQPAAAPAAAPAAGPSLLDQLNQLDALHQQGALTDNEFTAAKAKLLGS